MVYDTCNEETDIYRKLVLKNRELLLMMCHAFKIRYTIQMITNLFYTLPAESHYNLIQLFVRKDGVKILMQIQGVITKLVYCMFPL